MKDPKKIEIAMRKKSLPKQDNNNKKIDVHITVIDLIKKLNFILPKAQLKRKETIAKTKNEMGKNQLK